MSSVAASASVNERITATVVVLGWAALFAAAGLLPWGRLWAINHLAFLPSVASWTFAVFIAAAIAAIWNVRESPGDARTHPAQTLLRWLPVIVIVWIALAWLLRAATPLLGDGYLLVDDAERRPPSFLLLAELLPGLILTSFQQNVGAGIGLTPRDTVAGLSVLSGALFLLGTTLLWPRAVTPQASSRDNRRPSPWSAFWLLTVGAVAIFAGYYEAYGLPTAALTMFALAAIAHANRRLSWGWPLALWLLSFWSHLVSVGWIPALLWTLARGAPDRRQKLARVATALAAIVGSVVLIALLRTAGTPFLWHRYLLPLWSEGYALLDWRHGADLLNHLLLLVPVLLLLLLPDRGREAGRWPSLALWLSLPSVAFCIAFAGDLGWARDWDLYALGSMPGIVVAMIYFARVQARWPAPRRLAAAAVAVSGLGLWMWVNASEAASVGRFQYLLQLDQHLGTAGNEVMARYWREAERWDLVVDELGRGLAKEPHARLAVQRGIAWSKLGRYDSALVAYRQAVRYDPGMADGYLGTGQALALLGFPDSAQNYFAHAVAIDSTRADFRYNLGMCLISQGNFADALPQVAFAATRNPNQPMLINAWGMALGETGHADSAAAVLSDLLRRQPLFDRGYASLAWVHWTRGDTARAAAALREYERRVPEHQRVGPAVIMRNALDSSATKW